jgi:hypothetical protein
MAAHAKSARSTSAASIGPTTRRTYHEYFGHQPWLELQVVAATSDFLAALRGKLTMRGRHMAMRGVCKNILKREPAAHGASFIATVSRRLTNDLREVGSVDYRVTTKPPATIECG